MKSKKSTVLFSKIHYKKSLWLLSVFQVCELFGFLVLEECTHDGEGACRKLQESKQWSEAELGCWMQKDK